MSRGGGEQRRRAEQARRATHLEGLSNVELLFEDSFRHAEDRAVHAAVVDVQILPSDGHALEMLDGHLALGVAVRPDGRRHEVNDLLEFDCAIPIDVEAGKCHPQLRLADSKPYRRASFTELIEVDRAVSVSVGSPKRLQQHLPVALLPADCHMHLDGNFGAKALLLQRPARALCVGLAHGSARVCFGRRSISAILL